MQEYRLGEVETRFARLIWENEPIPSGELVKRAEAELNWKKSTTYTVLRRLCERGIFRNDNGTVTSLISREELEGIQTEQFVDETFGGSLPQFFAAFARRKKLTDGEIAELKRLIEENRR